MAGRKAAGAAGAPFRGGNGGGPPGAAGRADAGVTDAASSPRLSRRSASGSSSSDDDPMGAEVNPRTSSSPQRSTRRAQPALPAGLQAHNRVAAHASRR
ncbi:Hypothetical protein AA314_02375 [Archangium gephyra]|uniref:Uncharacterized protein n=1 Tax=Archangium gephyra TaxID=48 RepID=A0AAC8Q4E0_9BACT|nr:Hypothetical protein AA314_02375 [Archangium gephyra]